MDMGDKPIYKLTTASGKTIRTTGNHPYFVKIQKLIRNIKQKSTIFEVDQSNRIEELNRDSFVSIANKELAYTIRLLSKDKKQLHDNYKQKRKNRRFIGWQTFVKAVASAVRLSNFRVTDLVIDFEYPGYEQEIPGLFKQLLPEVEISFKSIGKKSPAHQSACRSIKNTETLTRVEELLHYGIDTVDSQSTRLLFKSIAKQDDLSSPNSETGEWKKVSRLQEGMDIAVVGAVHKSSEWDKIVKIKQLPAEQVYDIEVEKTHNFVANGIIAHNTYISSDLLVNGNVGIGDTGPDYKLEVLATTTQLALTNEDGTYWAEFYVDGSGDLTINPSGGNITFA